MNDCFYKDVRGIEGEYVPSKLFWVFYSISAFLKPYIQYFGISFWVFSITESFSFFVVRKFGKYWYLKGKNLLYWYFGNPWQGLGHVVDEQ